MRHFVPFFLGRTFVGTLERARHPSMGNFIPCLIGLPIPLIPLRGVPIPTLRLPGLRGRLFQRFRLIKFTLPILGTSGVPYTTFHKFLPGHMYLGPMYRPIILLRGVDRKVSVPRPMTHEVTNYFEDCGVFHDFFHE